MIAENYQDVYLVFDSAGTYKIQAGLIQNTTLKESLSPKQMPIFALTITVGGGGTMVVLYGIYLLFIKIRMMMIKGKESDTKNVKVKIADAYMVDEDFTGFVLANGAQENSREDEQGEEPKKCSKFLVVGDERFKGR